MATVPTVTVFRKRDGARMVINADRFDPALHTKNLPPKPATRRTRKPKGNE